MNVIDVASSDGLNTVVVVGGTVVVLEGAVVGTVMIELVVTAASVAGTVGEVVLAPVVENTATGETDGWLAVLLAQAVGRRRSAAPATILMPNPPIATSFSMLLEHGPRAARLHNSSARERNQPNRRSPLDFGRVL
jgi:hypothetical protein